MYQKGKRRRDKSSARLRLTKIIWAVADSGVLFYQYRCERLKGALSVSNFEITFSLEVAGGESGRGLVES